LSDPGLNFRALDASHARGKLTIQIVAICLELPAGRDEARDVGHRHLIEKADIGHVRGERRRSQGEADDQRRPERRRNSLVENIWHDA
jgi:hypothetical protein